MSGSWSRAAVLAFGLSWLPAAAMACGPDSDCMVEGGEYRIRMPEGWDGDDTVGAIVFLHGYRGSATAEMANEGLGRAISNLGLALVTPNGESGRWTLPMALGPGRDEISFINAVLDDVIANHHVDASRIMASGFSLGASMVWYLACYMGERFAGFAPIAGAFWEPQPETCPSRTPNLIHVHGLQDRTVPMAGRELGSGRRQGNVMSSLAVWTERGHCTGEAPATAQAGELTCERRHSCGGATIQLCLHPDGHKLRAEWVVRAWQEFGDRLGWRGQPAGRDDAHESSRSPRH